MGTLSGYFDQLSRRKKLMTLPDANDGIGTGDQLRKRLGTFDLIFLGVGSTLGVGIYILAGTVAKEYSGPAIILSFLISALVTLLAGLCYAEFGARAPSSGSIYSYSYMTLGEFVAYLMGWNLITQYMIGSAGVIKTFSVYTDSFLNNTMQNFYREFYEIQVPFLSEYFDIFAFFMAMALAVMLSYGLKQSMLLNNALTAVNVTLVLFFVTLGAFYINGKNWTLSANQVPPTAGSGGFFPFGLAGVIKGAAACFYGFIGFDCIATTGAEVQNPKKIPMAIITTLAICLLAYLSLSAVLTLMVPYYLQDDTAPLAFAFQYVNVPVAQYIVRIGSFFGLSASLIGAFFPISRIMYSMAQDGLLFRILGRVSSKYETPVTATIISGVLTGLTAALLDVQALVNLNSLGTLLSYTIVAFCIIMLRYADVELVNTAASEVTPLLPHERAEYKKVDRPAPSKREGSSTVLVTYLAIFCVLSGLLSLVIGRDIPFKLIVIAAISCIIIFVLILIQRLKSNKDKLQLPFQVPLVPYTPALCIFLNIFLMVQFDLSTWINFAFWLILGLTIYFTYGIFHSNERRTNRNDN